jgi:hypothetical protein
MAECRCRISASFSGNPSLHNGSSSDCVQHLAGRRTLTLYRRCARTFGPVMIIDNGRRLPGDSRILSKCISIESCRMIDFQVSKAILLYRLFIWIRPCLPANPKADAEMAGLPSRFSPPLSNDDNAYQYPSTMIRPFSSEDVDKILFSDL